MEVVKMEKGSEMFVECSLGRLSGKFSEESLPWWAPRACGSCRVKESRGSPGPSIIVRREEWRGVYSAMRKGRRFQHDVLPKGHWLRHWVVSKRYNSRDRSGGCSGQCICYWMLTERISTKSSSDEEMLERQLRLDSLMVICKVSV